MAGGHFQKISSAKVSSDLSARCLGRKKIRIPDVLCQGPGTGERSQQTDQIPTEEVFEQDAYTTPVRC